MSARRSKKRKVVRAYGVKLEGELQPFCYPTMLIARMVFHPLRFPSPEIVRIEIREVKP